MDEFKWNPEFRTVATLVRLILHSPVLIDKRHKLVVYFDNTQPVFGGAVKTYADFFLSVRDVLWKIQRTMTPVLVTYLDCSLLSADTLARIRDDMRKGITQDQPKAIEADYVVMPLATIPEPADPSSEQLDKLIKVKAGIERIKRQLKETN